ncbi:MAG: tRNA (adenosine(37)-N6)-threonylcarbamoyltransferase complex ATPase subunit type 1 TsaE [Prevotella sp.]|jgi:tRNA threonylcarbamoyladenosine biosynthesis protein TsaE|nr:tRNA (adenosine(37)-N6)-threonylcarbamoyltransferase complex ATPase subunit type 1 TsaE [Prevotella sp.]
MTLTITNIDNINITVKKFISAIGENKVIAFYGKMGAGKTTFIKALCEELGVRDVITSPTFAIVNEYNASTQSIFHFDFYRIKKIEEVYDMGYEDYIYSGNLCLIEWPELIEELLPEDTLRVTIEQNADNTRTITL